MVGFLIRARGICAREFLDDEKRYIRSAFKKLLYPDSLLTMAEEIAGKISARNHSAKLASYFLLFSANAVSDGLSGLLGEGGEGAPVTVAKAAGTKICEMMSTKGPSSPNDNNIVYSIRRGACPKAYISES